MKRAEAKKLKSGDTIGILGGGQLGRMLSVAASRLGLKTIVLEPGIDCPAAQTCNRHIVAEYDEPTALGELVNNCDVITYEFENIPQSAVLYLEEHIALLPNADALEKSQDRLVEKQFLKSCGIETAPFADITSFEALVEEAGKPDFNGILKTRRMGYDGKGQVRISAKTSKEELKAAWQSVKQVPCVLEGFVNFEREISVIAARGLDGEIACYDPAENVHKNGILHTSTLPANISDKIAKEAKAVAAKILTKLNYVGVMGVEFFVGKDGTLIVNEIAPRVHNSGHWTEAACAINQFEQHIRAISGMKLGDTKRHSDCVMENLTGDDVERMDALLNQPNTHIHLYGKAEVKKGRKMGHFTRLL